MKLSEFAAVIEDSRRNWCWIYTYRDISGRPAYKSFRFTKKSLLSISPELLDNIEIRTICSNGVIEVYPAAEMYKLAEKSFQLYQEG